MRTLLLVLGAAMISGAPLAVVAVAAPLRHAFFSSSEPAPNARLPTSPTRIVITFTGEIAVAKSSIELLRSDGGAVPLPPPQAGATQQGMVVPLATPLAPGAYAVRWKSVDAHDADEQQGYFAFTIGPDAPANLRGLSLTASAEGVSAELDITPGRLGENTYRVRTTAAGTAFVPERVALRFTPAALGVQSEAVSLTRGSDGFTGTGMELAVSGAYRIIAGVRRAGAAQDIALTFELTAPARPAATPSPSPTPTPTAPPTPTATPTSSSAPSSTPTVGGDPAVPLVALIAALAAVGLLAAIALRRRRG